MSVRCNPSNVVRTQMIGGASHFGGLQRRPNLSVRCNPSNVVRTQMIGGASEKRAER
jgi:hypothetical protein